MRERRCRRGIGHAGQLLGEDGAAELLLRRDVLCHLGIEQRFLTSARRHFDAHHGVIGPDHHLSLQTLFIVGAAVEDHRGRHRVGSHLAPGPSHQDAVGARERLGGHVTLAVSRVGRVSDCVRIGQQGAARGGPRRGERADRAWRLLHDHVDVGIAVPGEFQLNVSNERPIDTRPKLGCLVRMPRFFKRIDGCLRQPCRPRENLALVGRPFVRQHAGACPPQRGHVVGTGGERHGEGVGLTICRVKIRHLFAQANRPAR